MITKTKTVTQEHNKEIGRCSYFLEKTTIKFFGIRIYQYHDFFYETIKEQKQNNIGFNTQTTNK